MPQKDDWGRTCGYLSINEEDKKKKFEKRYFILNKLHGHLEWYTNNPLVSILFLYILLLTSNFKWLSFLISLQKVTVIVLVSEIDLKPPLSTRRK